MSKTSKKIEVEQENVVEKKTAKKSLGNFIVWLKTRAYINDTERVEAGVYLLDEVPARLAKQKEAVVVFEGTVPSRDLAKIARWAGMNPDGMDDDELMVKLVSAEMKTF
jgi:hypothetical protein